MKPVFKDYVDEYHISVMSGITLSGLTLKPLLISVTQNLPEEIVNSPFGGTKPQVVISMKMQ